MADQRGRFVWYELMTTDPPAARAFYNQVVGWSAMDAQMPNMDYWMFQAGETPVAGCMLLPEPARAMGTPPSWLGYVGVDDVDASVATATANGGKVYMPPQDIMTQGRIAVIGDPHGAAIALYKAANPDQDPLPDQQALGHIGWNDLSAGDLDSAWDFYSKLFGWVKTDSMDMGPAGTYQMFGVGDLTLGGMATKRPEVPMPYWAYFFNVANIDAAVGRVKAAGGQVLGDVMEVPGGVFIAMGMDPQGAAFALVGPR